MMRRVYWVIISLMLLLFLFLFAFEQNHETELSIYTDIARKSMLLAELDDDIVIDLFLNQNQTFYTEIEYLSSSRFEDDTHQIPITINQFRYMGPVIFDTLGSLFHYQVFIRLNETFQDSFHLQMNDVILTLEYYPNLSISLPIGSLNLVHPANYENSTLGFHHLYAIPSTTEGCPAMSALVIGLERKQNLLIELHRVTLGFHEEQELQHPMLVYKPPLQTNLYPTRSDFSLTQGAVLITEDEIYILIELDAFSSHRFYLSIEFSVNGTNDTLWIDDFIYFSIPITGGCYERQLHRTIISYFHS